GLQPRPTERTELRRSCEQWSGPAWIDSLPPPRRRTTVSSSPGPSIIASIGRRTGGGTWSVTRTRIVSAGRDLRAKGTGRGGRAAALGLGRVRQAGTSSQLLFPEAGVTCDTAPYEAYLCEPCIWPPCSPWGNTLLVSSPCRRPAGPKGLRSLRSHQTLPSLR